MKYFETKRNQLVSVGDITGFCTGQIPGLYIEAGNTKKYVDGKATDKYEFTFVKCQSKQLGDMKLLFPYTPGLSEQLNSQFEFGDLFTSPDLGNVEDISIGIYNERLTFKFYCSIK